MAGNLLNIDPDLIVNTADAARLLGVSEREVRAKIQRGTLPAIMFGGKYFINVGACNLYDSLVGAKKRKSVLSISAAPQQPPVNSISFSEITKQVSKPQCPPLCTDPMAQFWKDTMGGRGLSFPYHR